MKRIAFLDYLRAIAIFMVFIVHSSENFYFGEDGGLLLQSPESARWTIGIDSAARACVPLLGISINCRTFPESSLKEDLARDILL